MLLLLVPINPCSSSYDPELSALEGSVWETLILAALAKVQSERKACTYLYVLG